MSKTKPEEISAETLKVLRKLLKTEPIIVSDLDATIKLDDRCCAALISQESAYSFRLLILSTMQEITFYLHAIKRALGTALIVVSKDGKRLRLEPKT